MYGFYREMEGMDSKVMFVVVGALDMSVTIAHFTPNQCQILANVYNPQLGRFDINTVLADYFVANLAKDSFGYQVQWMC